MVIEVTDNVSVTEAFGITNTSDVNVAVDAEENRLLDSLLDIVDSVDCLFVTCVSDKVDREYKTDNSVGDLSDDETEEDENGITGFCDDVGKDFFDNGSEYEIEAADNEGDDALDDRNLVGKGAVVVSVEIAEDDLVMFSVGSGDMGVEATNEAKETISVDNERNGPVCLTTFVGE